MNAWDNSNPPAISNENLQLGPQVFWNHSTKTYL